MVHVVGAEARAHQLLEQISFLVGAFGTAETGQGVRAVLFPYFLQPLCRPVQGLLPVRFPEVLVYLVLVYEVGSLGHAVTAYKGAGEAVRMVGIVKTITPLDAQTAGIGGSVTAVHGLYLAVLDVEIEQAAHAAIRAYRRHRLVGNHVAGSFGGHQCPGGTGLYAFSAGDTGAVAHGVIHVEDNLGVAAPEGVADNVIDLFLAAGPDAASTLYAGIQVDGYRGVGDVRFRLAALFEARRVQPKVLRPMIQFRGRGIGGFALGRHIGQQQLQDHLLRMHGPLALRIDLHVCAGCAAAGRRQYALSLDLHHAGPAIAVGTVAVLVA